MRVPVGRVARAHGVRGYVRVVGGASLDRVSHLVIGDETRTIEQAEAAPGGWLVKLVGVDDRDAADLLRGREVAVLREELPPPEEGEMYLADLVGCAVVDPAGAPLGTVSGVVEGAGHDLVVVRRPDGHEAMVPLVPAIVTDVDLDARRVICDPPEGLLEL